MTIQSSTNSRKTFLPALPVSLAASLGACAAASALHYGTSRLVQSRLNLAAHPNVFKLCRKARTLSAVVFYGAFFVARASLVGHLAIRALNIHKGKTRP